MRYKIALKVVAIFLLSTQLTACSFIFQTGRPSYGDPGQATGEDEACRGYWPEVVDYVIGGAAAVLSGLLFAGAIDEANRPKEDCKEGEWFCGSFFTSRDFAVAGAIYGLGAATFLGSGAYGTIQRGKCVQRFRAHPEGWAPELEQQPPAAELLRTDLGPLVVQGGTVLTWARCPVGQTWKGYCEGMRYGFTWAKAQAACPAGFRLPTREELTGVLEGCDGSVLVGEVGLCQTCQASAACRAMFGTHDGDFWTSALTADGLRAIAVSFERGTLINDSKDARKAVRCVRVAEPAAVKPQ